MYAIQCPASVRNVLSKEEFAAIEARLEEAMKGEIPTRNFPPFGNDRDIVISMLNYEIENGEWHHLTNELPELLNTDLPSAAKMGWLAVLAVAEASSLHFEWAVQHSITAYTAQPTFGESYLAMAILKLHAGQPNDALRWFALAKKASTVSAFWVDDTKQEIDWLKIRVTDALLSAGDVANVAGHMNTQILPLLLSDAGLNKLKCIASSLDFEDESFKSAIETIRADHSSLQDVRESNSILFSLFARLAGSSHMRWSLPEPEDFPEVISRCAGSFAQLPHSVLYNIAKRLQPGPITRLRMACRPLYHLLDNPALWKSFIDGVVSPITAFGLINDEEWKEAFHQYWMCAIPFTVIVRTLSKDGTISPIIPEESLTRYRDLISSVDLLGPISYKSPTTTLWTRIVDFMTLYPDAHRRKLAWMPDNFPIYHHAFMHAERALTEGGTFQSMMIYAMLLALIHPLEYRPVAQSLGLESVARYIEYRDTHTHDGVCGLLPAISTNYPLLSMFTFRPVSLSRLSRRPRGLDSKQWNGVYHLAMTWKEETNYSSRTDASVLKIAYKPAQRDDGGRIVCSLSGTAYDTFQGNARIFAEDGGVHLNAPYLEVISFVYEMENGEKLHFRGQFYGFAFGGYFDVYNPNPEQSVVEQGLKSDKLTARIGSWFMFADGHGLNAETSKRVSEINEILIESQKPPINIDGDRFELWRSVIDSLKIPRLNPYPWRSTPTDVSLLLSQVRVFNNFLATCAMDNCDMVDFAIMKRYRELFAWATQSLSQNPAEMQSVRPCKTKYETTAKFQNRAHYHPMVVRALNFLRAKLVFAMLPEVREDYNIICDYNHPNRRAVISKWKTRFLVSPFETTFGENTVRLLFRDSLGLADPSNPDTRGNPENAVNVLRAAGSNRESGRSAALLATYGIFAAALVGIVAYLATKSFNRSKRQ